MKHAVRAMAAAAFVLGFAALAVAVPYTLSQTFDDPTVTTADLFGGSVAIDGNKVLVGAHGDDTNGTDVGQAFLFNATTGALLQTFNDPTVTTVTCPQLLYHPLC